MAQRRQRPVEHVRRPAAIDQHAVAFQRDLEAGKRCEPRGLIGGSNPTPRPDEIGAMQAERRDGVGGGEAPAGNNDCTISKPCAIQSMQPSSAASSMPGSGARARPKAISGSMRGSTTAARSKAASVRSRTVVSYMSPQIGANTPYSAQIVRLVKPILRPIGRSPRAVRRCRTAAVTAYAASRSKPGWRAAKDAIWRRAS
jgi:hypothetical protein